MPEIKLSVPSIRVNNNVIGIVPNTFSYKAGDGEVKVTAASTGGGNAVSVHGQDAETMFSTLKFSVYPTISNISLIRDWKAAVAGNTLDAMQKGSPKDFGIAFKGLSVTNDPDINAGADTVIDIEMAGDKIAQ